MTQSTSNPLSSHRAAELASAGILACQPDAPLDEVAWLMANNRVHAVLVTDDTTSTPPVIADTDLVAAAASGHFDELSARDIAATESVSINEDDTLDRAAQLLEEHRVSHLLVKNGRGEPVGVISTLDLARVIAGR